jgi:PhnB protein
MVMKGANPYLNFPGNTYEAFTFYRSVFGGDFIGVTRFGDLPGNPMGVPDKDLDKIANIGLPLGNGNMLMATDALDSWPEVRRGNNFYIHVEADSGEEAERIFSGLGEGGRVEMPLQRTEWAEQYGTLEDRFGVQWMVGYTGSVDYTHPAKD